MHNKNQKKYRCLEGSIAVFVLFLMFLLVVITISIITTATIERKSSISTGNSTTAFQIAESGMERTLQFFRSNFDKKISDIYPGHCVDGVVATVIFSSNNTIKFKNNAAMPAYIASCDEWISNVKIIKSIGTTKQETRVIEEDVFLGTTKLLLHLDGIMGDQGSGIVEIPDSSYYYYRHSPITIENDNTYESDAITDVDKKFGEASAYFDGSLDYISVLDSNDWDLGTGDFTIDFWVNFSSLSGNRMLLDRNSNPRLYYSGGNLYGLGKTFAWTPTVGIWYHIALVRQNDVLSMYVNGSSVGSPQSDSTDINGDGPLYIGTSYNLDQYFHGYIDELRISKDMVRWSSNFTPSVVEYWPD